MTGCRWTTLGIVLLAALATPACGQSKGKVQGMVTYAGKPVSGGMILFVGADKEHPVRAPIDGEGNYQASDVPVGEVKVAVLGPPPPLKPPPLPKNRNAQSASPQEPSIVSIPQQYTNPESSGLTCQVSSGSKQYNIDLK
jgi:hypothetical protein